MEGPPSGSPPDRVGENAIAMPASVPPADATAEDATASWGRSVESGGPSRPSYDEAPPRKTGAAVPAEGSRRRADVPPGRRGKERRQSSNERPSPTSASADATTNASNDANEDAVAVSSDGSPTTDGRPTGDRSDGAGTDPAAAPVAEPVADPVAEPVAEPVAAPGSGPEVGSTDAERSGRLNSELDEPADREGYFILSLVQNDPQCPTTRSCPGQEAMLEACDVKFANFECNAAWSTGFTGLYRNEGRGGIALSEPSDPGTLEEYLFHIATELCGEQCARSMRVIAIQDRPLLGSF